MTAIISTLPLSLQSDKPTVPKTSVPGMLLWHVRPYLPLFTPTAQYHSDARVSLTGQAPPKICSFAALRNGEGREAGQE